MAKVSNEAYQQLIERLEEMVREIRTNRHAEITENLDDFWYMQKSAELILLKEQFTEAFKRTRELREWMDRKYMEIGRQYKNDLRWLKKYHERKKTRSGTNMKPAGLKNI